MKALVLHEPNSPFVLEDRPDPQPGPGEAVARVLACGSGLTIEHVRAGRSPATFPIVIGHEITGEIVAVGARAVGDLSHALPGEALKVGDAVTSYFYLIDGEDRWTRDNRPTISSWMRGYVGRQVDGGYAEYIKLPMQNFIKLPEGLDHRADPAGTGVVCDALATPFKVLRRARIRPTDTVAVFGAGGGLGLHQVIMNKWAHNRVIAVETKADKFDAIRAAGADEVVDASSVDVVEALRDLTGGGVDVAIDYVSSRTTLEQAVAALGIGGRLVTLGGSGADFTASASAMLSKELELLGSRYCTRQEVIDTLELYARGEFAPVVTETAPLDPAAVGALHDRVEQGLVTGRAAVVVG